MEIFEQIFNYKNMLLGNNEWVKYKCVSFTLSKGNGGGEQGHGEGERWHGTDRGRRRRRTEEAAEGRMDATNDSHTHSLHSPAGCERASECPHHERSRPDGPRRRRTDAQSFSRRLYQIIALVKSPASN